MLTCAIGVIFFRYVSFYCLPIYNELEKNVLKMHVYVIVQLLHPYTFSSVWCQMLHDACRKLCIVRVMSCIYFNWFFFFTLCKSFTSAVIYTVPWYMNVYIYLHIWQKKVIFNIFLLYNRFKFTYVNVILKSTYTQHPCNLEKSLLLHRIYK